MDLTGETKSLFATGEESVPEAKAHKERPFTPSHPLSVCGEVAAMSPIVWIPYPASFFSVALPTYIISEAGSGHTFSL